MTPQEFISEIQGYYGVKYSAVQLKYVGGWLTKKLPGALPLILIETMKQFSSSYKTAPGIKELEDAAKEVRTHRSHEIKQDVKLLPDEADITDEEAMENFKKINEMLDITSKEKKA